MRRLVLPLALATALTAASVNTAHAEPDPDDIGRQTLPEGDGWGSAGAGTTGGSEADPENTFHVSTMEEFRDAVGDADNDTSKIVYVEGTIDGNTTPEGETLKCEDYVVGDYSLDDYLETYDPEEWGWDEPTGPLEEDRLASAEVQAEQIQVEVGSNTTIVGTGDDATITGVNLLVRDVENVILRNMTFSDAHDCFPGWDPTDGDSGEWNSEYDNVEISGSTNVWVDHNRFDDGDNPGTELPEYFDRKYEVHDGLLDIVRATDLVTVTRNHFEGRDKALLLGNSDSATEDRGYLRITWHHNHFDGLGERAPRVRYGQVHVYNNYYTVDSPHFEYSLGVGVESHLYAENNVFDLHNGIGAEEILHNWGGTDIAEQGNVLLRDGGGRLTDVDLVQEYNGANPEDDALGTEVTWVPQLVEDIEPVHAVRGVPRRVGPGLL